MQQSLRRPATLGQWLLGLFVAGQLLFIVGSNVLAFFPVGGTQEGELTDARGAPDTGSASRQMQLLETANGVFQAWAHATGQLQTWWLFAPSFPAQATFPHICLHWDAHPVADVCLPSIQEPADPASYFRLPGSYDRFFHYEVRLGLLATGMDRENLEHEANAWRDAIRGRVSRQWKSMRAYMRWRATEFAREHPELPPPSHVVLSMRIYKTPPPGTVAPSWPAPLQQPLARWVPALERRPDCLPIEAFDPVRKQFTLLDARE